MQISTPKFKISLSALVIVLVTILSTGQLNAQCSVTTGPTNNCSYGDAIDSFTLNGTTVSNAGCSNSSGYIYFPSPIFNLTAGSSYPISLTVGGATYNQGVTIWIDLNNNGLFETTEVVFTTATSALTHTGTLTVPGTATAATVRMRVMCTYNTTPNSGQACTSDVGSYGETEDYQVTIAPMIIPGPDANAGALAAPADNDCGSAMDSVWVLISNEGTDTVSNLPFVTNLTGLATGSYPDTLAQILPGDSVNVFVTSVNTIAGGVLNVELIMLDTADVNSANDTLNSTVTLLNGEPLAITGPATACMGATATLNINTNGGETYTWYENTVGGTMILTADSIVVLLEMDTTFAVSSSNTCRTPDQLTVDVMDTTSLMVMGPDSVCEGDMFFLAVNAISGEAYSWHQDSLNGTIVGSGDSLMTTAVNGVSMYYVTSSNTCRNSGQFGVAVAPLPTGSFTASTVFDTVTFAGTTTNTTSASWDFGDGNTSTDANPTHVFGTAGTYYVCLTTTNDCGSSTFCDSVTVSLPVGMEGYADSQITLFPNPTRDIVTVRLINMNGLEGDWMVTDLQGKILQQQNVTVNSDNEETKLSLRDLPNGTYLFKLNSGGNSFSRVVVKQ